MSTMPKKLRESLVTSFATWGLCAAALVAPTTSAAQASVLNFLISISALIDLASVVGWRVALPALAKYCGLEQLEPEGRVVPVDFLHVELAHELDGVRRDHLARHHDREAGRVGDHEGRRHQL